MQKLVHPNVKVEKLPGGLVVTFNKPESRKAPAETFQRVYADWTLAACDISAFLVAPEEAMASDD